MKFYIDSEFHENFHKPLFGRRRHFIDLISIGLVAEDGREYYAVSKDFDIKAAWLSWQHRTGQGDRNNHETREYWLRDNVLRPLFNQLITENQHMVNHHRTDSSFNLYNFKRIVQLYGKSNVQIAEEVRAFVEYKHEMKFPLPEGHFDKVFMSRAPVEFYGFYADYDWVLLCSLFGRRNDLPRGFPMFCMELKELLDQVSLAYGMCHNMDWTREQMLQSVKSLPGYPRMGNHHALSDAKWNRSLDCFLRNLAQDVAEINSKRI